MNQHKHYQVVEAGCKYDLLTQVNNMINDGWIPCGGAAQLNGIYRQTLWVPPIPTEIIIPLQNAKAMKAIKND
tara:strand:+ start:544 stop:762 length:219 start_codon:yes stop_codon:yes gene_type:complete